MNSPRASLCRQTESLLLVVDIQTRILAAMQASERNAVIDGAGRLMQAAGLLDIPTVVTEQYPSGLGRIEPALGAQLPPVCECVEKTAFCVCGVAAFDRLLAMSGRSQVVICGVEAHVCVLQSALQLQHEGFEVFIAADVVCSRSVAHRDNALSRLSAAGVFISNTESIIFEWLRGSEHPAFQEVATLTRQLMHPDCPPLPL